MKDKEEEVIKDIKALEQELDVLNTQNKLAERKCRICNAKGANLLSFAHKGPVHRLCLEQLAA
jgi:hypothetical protein